MAEVRTPGHDFKVFFRRLIVPGELGRDLDSILLPSQVAGQFDDPARDPNRTAQANAFIEAANNSDTDAGFRTNVGKLLDDTFKDYKPDEFRKNVLAKASKVSTDFRQSIVDKTKALISTNKKIDATRATLDAITGPPGLTGPTDTRGLLKTLPQEAAKSLSDEATYFADHSNDPIEFVQKQIAAEDAAQSTAPVVSLPGLTTTGTPPINSARLHATRVESLLKEYVDPLNDITAIEINLVDDIKAGCKLLITEKIDPDVERDTYLALATDIRNLLSFRAPSQDNRSEINQLNNFLSTLTQGAQALTAELATLKAASPLRPFYDPILLDCLLGPQQVQASGNRLGQPGTAAVTFHLPLNSNGLAPDLFMGFVVDDIFSLATLEQGGKSIPSRTMSILTSNMRETTIRLFDMVQIWGRKKLSTGSTFPGDYSCIFTGFVTKTAVGYSGSSVSVTVSAEDVGKVVRLARVHVDPALDQNFRAAGINVTALNNVLQSAQFKTGASIIEGLLKGSSGTLLGLSQVEVLEKVEIKSEGGQTIPKFTPRTRIVSLAADFQNIKLNLFEDLINRWPPYATQFKNAFRLWETDARTKWDICREVADVTEFEFYVDNLGVVNYHPPLYFLNPFAAQYFIEDVDIESESHNTDESEVLTAVEVHSQPSFIPDTVPYNALRRNDSLITAPDAVIQRFGVRWQKKSVPILSGSDPVAADRKSVNQNLRSNSRDAGRDGYARAWMNRRNARLRSATVTINGTPEIRMCNTVAFVGNLQQMMKTVATNQIAANAAGILGTITAASLSQGSSPGAVSALKNILVYYVSAVSHNYLQGGRYTTTLTLTHGRHWTDPLPQGNVGYSLDAKDTDGIVGQMKDAYGQSLTGADADAFVRAINNKIQFIATGDTSFLDNPDSSQFGFATRAPKPSLLTKFRSALASEINGAIARANVQFCTILSQWNDPYQVSKKAKDEADANSLSLSKLLSDAWNLITKGASSIETLAAKKLAELGDKLNQAISDGKKKLLDEAQQGINDIEEKAFGTIMGGKTIKILAQSTVDAGAVIPKATLSQFKAIGVDTSRITSFPFGVALYVYISRSEVSVTDARTNAEIYLKTVASGSLNPSSPGQLKVIDSSVVESTQIEHVAISAAVKPSSTYFVTGFIVIGVKVSC